MSHAKSTIARPDADTLRRLYVDERKGCPEIGRLYERDAKTVLWWLRQAGIPTRTRGSYQPHKVGQPSPMKGRNHTPEARAKVRAAAIARGTVPYLRNGQHWLKGQPASANGRWLGGVTPERQAFYRSPEWKAACVEVWKRADAKCERCGRDHRLIDRSRESFDVHHIVTFAVRELRAVPSNLVLLCEACHGFVHSKANTAREFIDDYGIAHLKRMPDMFAALDAEQHPEAA